MINIESLRTLTSPHKRYVALRLRAIKEHRLPDNKYFHSFGDKNRLYELTIQGAATLTYKRCIASTPRHKKNMKKCVTHWTKSKIWKHSNIELSGFWDPHFNKEKNRWENLLAIFRCPQKVEGLRTYMNRNSAWAGSRFNTKMVGFWLLCVKVREAEKLAKMYYVWLCPLTVLNTVTLHVISIL